MASLAKINRMEAALAKLEEAKRAAEEAARPKVSGSERFLAAVGSLFRAEMADLWAEATDAERGRFWPAYELWRIMKRLEALGLLFQGMEHFAQWEHQKFDAYMAKYGAEADGAPEPQDGPITCEMLGSIKFTLRGTLPGFDEFGVRRAPQVGHLHYGGRTEESVRETDRRLAETGSLVPDPVPPFVLSDG